MKINNDLATNLNGTAHVFNEITGQPNLWKATFESVLSNKGQIAGFLKDILKIKIPRFQNPHHLQALKRFTTKRYSERLY